MDNGFEQTHQATATPASRAEDAIYQEGQAVARVADSQIDSGAKEIHFTELFNSDNLLLSDECEFQKYRIIVQRVEFASRIDQGAPEKGRVLRGVTAEILGYREQ